MKVRAAWWLAIALATGAAVMAQDQPAPGASGHLAPAPPASTMPEMPYAAMTVMMQMNDASRMSRILVDQLEFRAGGGAPNGAWDAQGWYGDDYDKLWVKSEGNWASGADARGRAELLWDRIVTRWWSLQGGVRYDFGGGPGKGWAAIGIQGLAPYWVNLEATLYAGSAGRLAARVKADTDLHFTQRLIAQPKLEFNAYSRPDRARDQGAGLADLETGLRLRYEIRRELAPYLGVAWVRRFGQTARLVRTAGELPNELQWLAGVRFWF